MNVGVRELKQHLSEFLDRAAAGEVVTITDRGVPKVQIVAIPDREHLVRGVNEGWLRAPARPGSLGHTCPATGLTRSSRVSDADRGE